MELSFSRKSFLIAILLLLSLTIFAFISLSLGKYYSYSDLFGLITDNYLIFCCAIFLISTILVLVLKNFYSQKISLKVELIAILMPILLLFVLKYVISDLTETYYVANFYDIPGQITRGLFVANTGHSDITVDGYFDTQPGFFWVTGIVLNALNGGVFSISSALSLFIMKWFHVLILLSYIPILFVFYGKLFNNITLSGFAIFLQFALDFGHYHYAGQSLGNLLYWLFLIIMMYYLSKNSSKLFYFLLLIGFSMIFVHEGLILFMLVAMVSTLFSPYIFRIIDRRQHFKKPTYLKNIAITLLIIVLGWFSYLIFLTIYSFGTFITILQSIVNSLISENISLISTGITRADPLWSQIVFGKALYLIILIVGGLFFSCYNALVKKSIVDKAIFSIQLFTVLMIGGISIAMGGAGYIERLEVTFPLVIYSLIRFIFNIQKPIRRKLINWHIPHESIFSFRIFSFIAIFLITITAFSGTLFYNSGRNFQSVTSSELAGSFFIIHYTPNIANLYSTGAISSASYLISHEQLPGVIYTIYYRNIINSALYSFGDYENASVFYSTLAYTNNQVYDSGKAQLIISP